MRIYLRLLVAFLLLSAGNIVYAEAQQEKRVTGTVTSEGEPLPGVSVQVKGASSGTITDIDGNSRQWDYRFPLCRNADGGTIGE